MTGRSGGHGPGLGGPAHGRPGLGGFAALAVDTRLRDLLVAHAMRGFRAQLVVRGLLVAFAALALVLEPPDDGVVAYVLFLAGYATWAVVVYAAVRGATDRVLRLSWIALFGDIVALAGLVMLSSWLPGDGSTAQVLLDGVFVMPVLAALQLRRWVAAAVLAPTLVVFVAGGFRVLGGDADALREVAVTSTALLAACVGSVLLVGIQQSRVLSLGRGLIEQRALSAAVQAAEDRERTELSERLHDGALQYLLAAKQDLDDLPDDVDERLRDRLQTAIRTSTAILRAEVAGLSPAVLEASGLDVALARLAHEVTARGRLAVTVDTSRWRGGVDASAERLLYDTARELIANVEKHAGASVAGVVLSSDEDEVVLEVVDDGRGFDVQQLPQRLGEGHIGLQTRRLRLETAGGRLQIDTAPDRGTRARATLPRTASPSPSARGV